MPAFTRAQLKRRIVALLDEFPQRLTLGTFRTEDLLVRLGHLMRELGRTLDNTSTEDLIYGKSPQMTLRELGDAYWELGVQMAEQRPRNRKRTIHTASLASVERSGL